MTTVAVKNIGPTCVVATHGDAADDVRAHLETAGLLVSPTVPVDTRSNMKQMVVSMPDGSNVSAENIRVMLGGSDDFVVVEWQDRDNPINE